MDRLLIVGMVFKSKQSGTFLPQAGPAYPTLGLGSEVPAPFGSGVPWANFEDCGKGVITESDQLPDFGGNVSLGKCITAGIKTTSTYKTSVNEED